MDSVKTDGLSAGGELFLHPHIFCHLRKKSTQTAAGQRSDYTNKKTLERHIVIDHIRISVIIPTLNAGNEIECLLGKLQAQTVKPDEIIIIDSDSNDNTVEICSSFENVRIIRINREEFDHGRTRDTALRNSTGDIIVFMTQDAVPYDDKLIHNLIQPLDTDDVVVSTGRQMAKNNASETERLFREFNYPEKSAVRNSSRLSELGIKTFFCSDVCAAYKKKQYIEIGGFEYPIKTNEDMFFAARAIQAGYSVAYAAEAKVYHSHNFTIKEQFKRNFIQGYEMEKHRELLKNVNPTGEGMKLVKYVIRRLLPEMHFISIIHFIADCGARLLGSKLGRKAYIRDRRKIKAVR